MLVQMEVFVSERTKQIEAMASAAQQRPKGLGALTEQIIAHEVIDWSRFNNRRQVSSYTGLCPASTAAAAAADRGTSTSMAIRD
jgi:transposase